MANQSEGSMNLIYFIKLLNSFVLMVTEGREHSWGIDNLSEHISHHSLNEKLQQIIMSKAKVNEVDGKKFLRNLIKTIESKDLTDDSWLEKQLYEFANHKYAQHIEMRKSCNTLSYYDILEKIFQLTDNQYLDNMVKPYLHLFTKVGQLAYWMGEEESLKEIHEDIEYTQLIGLGTLSLFVAFDGAVILDSKDGLPIEVDYESRLKTWETSLASIFSKIDALHLDSQLDMYANMLNYYLELHYTVNDELLQKTKGGQSNLIEAAFFASYYKSLKELKDERGFDFEIIEMEEDPLIYPATRDQWINALRNDLVDILNIIYKARGHHKRLSKYNSPETIRTLAMKVEKEKDTLDEKMQQFINPLNS